MISSYGERSASQYSARVAHAICGFSEATRILGWRHRKGRCYLDGGREFVDKRRPAKRIEGDHWRRAFMRR